MKLSPCVCTCVGVHSQCLHQLHVCYTRFVEEYSFFCAALLHGQDFSLVAIYGFGGARVESEYVIASCTLAVFCNRNMVGDAHQSNSQL